MALVQSGLFLLDGFDNIGANDENIADKLISFGYNSTNSLYSSTDTPHGYGSSLYGTFRWGYENSQGRRPIGGDCADLIVGFHVKLASQNAGVNLMGFTKENFLGQYTNTVWLLANGQSGLTLTSDARNVVYATTAANIFERNTWYFVEMRFNFQTGVFTLRLDEDVVIEAPICTAAILGLDVINVVRTLGEDSNGGVRTLYDNMYMSNGQGAVAPFDDFLGETVIYTSLPDADTGPNGFDLVTTTGEVEHFKAVDDPVIDDTNYLQTSEINDGEYFSVTNVPADTIEVIAVGVATRMRKLGGADGRFRVKARIGASELTLPSRPITSATFLTKLEVLPQKPGGGPWSIADANALQVGIETLGA
jgi:hypothetical protein